MSLANDWKKTARGQALEVLEEVFQEGAYSNIALNARLSNSCLTDKDKALVTEIVYGTVARKITLEWILAHVIEDRDKLEVWVYDLFHPMRWLTMPFLLPKIVAIKKELRSW